MNFSIKSALLVLILCISSCTSMHSELQNARLGLFKRQVLSKFGDPVEKYRADGRDHWVYETQKRSKNSGEPLVFQHTLIFEEGSMVDSKMKRTFTSDELETYYDKR